MRSRLWLRVAPAPPLPHSPSPGLPLARSPPLPMRTIAHISDLHFGKVDPPVAEGLIADLAGRKPDLLVVSGDFTQRARARQYEDAAAFLRRLPTPQLVVPGNHDIPMYDWGFIPRFVAPLHN